MATRRLIYFLNKRFNRVPNGLSLKRSFNSSFSKKFNDRFLWNGTRVFLWSVNDTGLLKRNLSWNIKISEESVLG